ncbi:MAG: hypothetical protein KBT03_10885, partial [Bacteroidales bacterium]|nr:hypothetical protein [Candidatus Scybalousia scybalohippi]
MDLIFTDENKVEQGILTHFSLDHEEASKIGNNTFQIKIGMDVPLNLGSLVYLNGTEYGGRITKVVTDTAKSMATYTGKTWRGLLEEKILRPNAGENYLRLTGDLNDIIKTLIIRCDMGVFFDASLDRTIEITYQFDRYTSMLAGIQKMLASKGYKLKMVADDGIITLSAVPIVDFEQQTEINSDLFAFKMTRQKYTCNHIIALGSGELAERMVVDKYIQADGTVGDEQFYFGTEEIVDVFDYPNAESIEDLTEQAVEELESRAIADGLSITAYDLKADVGDKVTAVDLKQNLSVTQYVI